MVCSLLSPYFLPSPNIPLKSSNSKLPATLSQTSMPLHKVFPLHRNFISPWLTPARAFHSQILSSLSKSFTDQSTHFHLLPSTSDAFLCNRIGCNILFYFTCWSVDCELPEGLGITLFASISPVLFIVLGIQSLLSK